MFKLNLSLQSNKFEAQCIVGGGPAGIIGMIEPIITGMMLRPSQSLSHGDSGWTQLSP